MPSGWHAHPDVHRDVGMFVTPSLLLRAQAHGHAARDHATPADLGGKSQNGQTCLNSIR